MRAVYLYLSHTHIHTHITTTQPAEPPRFYPNGSYHTYAGFRVAYTLSAYVAPVGDAAAGGRLVGFGSQVPPRAARD